MGCVLSAAGPAPQRQGCDRPGPHGPRRQSIGPVRQAEPHLCASSNMSMLADMDEITQLQAEVLKTLASPRRLEIIHRLAQGPCEVRRLAEDLGASQPNISQHLAVLRSTGLVDAERDGREVRYRLTDPDVVVACGLMRTVLQRRLVRLGRLSAMAETHADLVEIQ